jgi:hypothetical protein
MRGVVLVLATMVLTRLDPYRPTTTLGLYGGDKEVGAIAPSIGLGLPSPRRRVDAGR